MGGFRAKRDVNGSLSNARFQIGAALTPAKLRYRLDVADAKRQLRLDLASKLPGIGTLSSVQKKEVLAAHATLYVGLGDKMSFTEIREKVKELPSFSPGQRRELIEARVAGGSELGGGYHVGYGAGPGSGDAYIVTSGPTTDQLNYINHEVNLRREALGYKPGGMSAVEREEIFWKSIGGK